jgi:hypothetical protein
MVFKWLHCCLVYKTTRTGQPKVPFRPTELDVLGVPTQPYQVPLLLDLIMVAIFHRCYMLIHVDMGPKWHYQPADSILFLS